MEMPPPFDSVVSLIFSRMPLIAQPRLMRHAHADTPMVIYFDAFDASTACAGADADTRLLLLYFASIRRLLAMYGFELYGRFHAAAYIFLAPRTRAVTYVTSLSHCFTTPLRLRADFRRWPLILTPPRVNILFRYVPRQCLPARLTGIILMRLIYFHALCAFTLA